MCLKYASMHAQYANMPYSYTTCTLYLQYANIQSVSPTCHHACKICMHNMHAQLPACTAQKSKLMDYPIRRFPSFAQHVVHVCWHTSNACWFRTCCACRMIYCAYLLACCACTFAWHGLSNECYRHAEILCMLNLTQITPQYKYNYSGTLITPQDTT